MRNNVVVKALVVNGSGEVLTLRRSQTDTRRPGQWDFPGGWQDNKPGQGDEREDVFATAARECDEEAGLTVSGMRRIYQVSDDTPSGPCTWVTVYAQVEGQPDVKLSEEHDAYAWLPPEALLDRITYDRQLTMLSFILEHNLLQI